MIVSTRRINTALKQVSARGRMTEIWRDEVHERDRKEKLATYLFAMKEDLSEWITGLMNISVNADTFMNVLDNGIHLCRLANIIQKAAEKYLNENTDYALKLPEFVPTFIERGATHGSFVSRDNVANFIRWCRELGIADVIMFESEDLVLHKFEKPVILTLLDVARRASKFDIEPPDLVIMEEQIEEEIAMEQQAMVSLMSQVQEHHTKTIVVKPKKANAKQKAKNFIPKNLDTLVKETVQQCTCEDNPFPVEKIADGKYKIGENRVLIFVRVMRNHVMVRVGGGWDTLENYIQKHDPCRTGGRNRSNGGRQRSRCQTPNHHHNNNDHETSILHSASNTSVASSDSNSSASSLSRLSPVSSNNKNVLQGMVCVFGESGSRAEIVAPEKPSPPSDAIKRLEPPAKTKEKRKNSTPSRQTRGEKRLGSRHSSLLDVRDSGIETSKTKQVSAPRKSPNNKSGPALRATLQQADLSFNRSRTSDAILSRSKRRETDSPCSVVKRRGSGNISREASSENLRNSRPKSNEMRRKSVDERRRRSPEVRRRSAVSPVPARRKLEPEYDKSAEKSTAGRGARGQVRTATTASLLENYASPTRIPVPVITYGRPRGFNRTPVLNGESSRTSNGSYVGNEESSGMSNSVHRLNGELNRCMHCGGDSCTCDEGFIDGDGNRTPIRPTSLFLDKENDFQYKNKDPSNDCHLNYENSKFLEIPQQHNGDGTRFSGNADVTSQSLEWREVMSDILKYEENRVSEKNL